MTSYLLTFGSFFLFVSLAQSDPPFCNTPEQSLPDQYEAQRELKEVTPQDVCPALEDSRNFGTAGGRPGNCQVVVRKAGMHVNVFLNPLEIFDQTFCACHNCTFYDALGIGHAGKCAPVLERTLIESLCVSRRLSPPAAVPYFAGVVQSTGCECQLVTSSDKC